jgi:virginiamycin B lyase
MRLRHWLPVLFSVAFVAGCNGGNATAPPFNSGVAAPTFPPSTIASVTVGAAPASATFGPIAGGLAATIGFPATTSGSGTLSMSFGSVPSPAPAIQNIRRLPRDTGATGITGIAYVTVTPSTTTTFPASPTFTFVLSGASTIPSGSQAYIAIYVPSNVTAYENSDPPGTWSALLGPVTIGGNVTTWTFPSASVPLILQAGMPYVFGLFTATGAPITPGPTPTASPTPTATPTASPTPKPTPTPSASPSASPTPSASPSASPTITEFNAGPSSPAYSANSIAAGSDGAMWFGETGASAIGRMTVAGAYTSFSVPGADPTISQPAAIASGPDGALWFTGAGGSLSTGFTAGIGRISTSGAITAYTTPVTIASAITAGPDGNLWVVNGCCDGSIGQITTSGVGTKFVPPAPPQGTTRQMMGITTGPDGALWYVGQSDAGGSSMAPIVGRVTTTGVFTDYSEAAAIAGFQFPTSITTGPDGALWFTDGGAVAGNSGVFTNSAIGRLTTSGSFQRFALASPAGASQIAAGSDGALWFTDRQGNGIGRITTSGSVTEYKTGIPANADPSGIALGPDHALWFTQLNVTKIGRLGTAGQSTQSIRSGTLKR